MTFVEIFFHDSTDFFLNVLDNFDPRITLKITKINKVLFWGILLRLYHNYFYFIYKFQTILNDLGTQRTYDLIVN